MQLLDKYSPCFTDFVDQIQITVYWGGGGEGVNSDLRGHNIRAVAKRLFSNIC